MLPEINLFFSFKNLIILFFTSIHSDYMMKETLEKFVAENNRDPDQAEHDGS